jgi:hypothetical protein
MTTEPQSLEQMAESLLITPETDTEAPDEDQTEELVDEAVDETPEDEAEEVEAEGDETGEDEDDSEPEDEEEVEDETDEQDADEQPQTFTVKVDGEEVEVTLDELRRGYAGQSYIQKGMKETAELRKQTEAEQHALSQQRQQLQQLIQNVSQNGLQAPVAPDIAQLQSDPIGYMEAKAKYDNDRAEYDQKVHAIQEQQRIAQATEQQQRQAFLKEQQEYLAQVIPEFADPEKGPVLQRRLRETGKAYKFDDRELSEIIDGRAVWVLHDAMKYREMIAKKGEVTKKAAKARPVVKSGAKKAHNPAKVQREKARQRFQQTGRIEDAIDLMFDNPKGA